MNELFTVATPSDAFAELARRLGGPLERRERIAVGPGARGRVLAIAIDAGEALPAFARATMDGYAVRSEETFGASDASPAYLRLSGEVPMGTVARVPVDPGHALRVHTGAMLPPGADAVVMVEETNQSGDEIEIVRAVAPGENTLEVGEDVRRGECVFTAGRVLRIADLGALHALGITEIEVVAEPRVAVLATGDEVVAPADSAPRLGAVRDVNTVTVAATIAQAGGIPRSYGIVPDDEAQLERCAAAALAENDALVLSAGSSVSLRDITARVVDRLGRPGVLVHGIALRPGKPTIIALADGKPVIGLPGNPVSSVVVAWRLVRPLVRLLRGEPVPADGLPAGDAHTVTATLTANVPSRPGREDYVPVTLATAADGSLRATPVFGKSNLIFTLVRADGIVAIPLDRSGASAGSTVRVMLL